MTTDPSAFLTALRLSDSFLPVGGYTASYGLKQYLNEDRLEDGADLRELIAAYLQRVVGPCETVALSNAYAASAAGDLERLLAVDERLHAVTMPREFRESSTKAGTKLCELLGSDSSSTDSNASANNHMQDEASASATDGGDIVADFAAAIEADATPGHYPVVFGVVTAARDSRDSSPVSHTHIHTHTHTLVRDRTARGRTATRPVRPH